MTSKPVSSIVTKGILVDLSISRMNQSLTDKSVTEHVKHEFHANGNVGRYAKKLFPQDPDEIRKIGSIANEITAIHNNYTLPWMPGWRILPRDMHMDYSAKVAKARADMDVAVKALCAALPRLKSEAQQMLGKMYREDDYPSELDIVDAHGIFVNFMPVPDVNDFRVDLDKEMMDEVRRSYEADLQASMQDAALDLWYRLSDAVGALGEACTRVEQRIAAGEKVATMREAVIRNLRTVVESLPKLNITGDKKLEAIRKEVADKLAGLDIEVLRDHANTKARQEAAKRAADIVKKMEAFMGGSSN